MKPIKIFDYIPELDAFYVTPTYKEIADTLNLGEWTYVVWIGRLFSLDNDWGEHWFDNWDERAAIGKNARNLGYDTDALYIIAPDFFKDGKDGPCHTSAERKLFWTDVLKSLTLSFDTLATFAINNNPPPGDEDHITNIKRKIAQLREKLEMETE